MPAASLRRHPTLNTNFTKLELIVYINYIM
jgi:hypothetical protein